MTEFETTARDEATVKATDSVNTQFGANYVGCWK